MRREVFESVIELLYDAYTRDFANLCLDHRVTTYEVEEVLSELAPLGFEIKYNDAKTSSLGE